MGNQLTLWGCILRPFSFMLNPLLFVIPIEPHFSRCSSKQSAEKRANMLNLAANALFPHFSALTNPIRLAIIRLVHTIPL